MTTSLSFNFLISKMGITVVLSLQGNDETYAMSAYKTFTKFLECNRCSTDNPASPLSSLSLFLSPPSSLLIILVFSTEFLDREN